LQLPAVRTLPTQTRLARPAHAKDTTAAQAAAVDAAAAQTAAAQAQVREGQERLTALSRQVDELTAQRAAAERDVVSLRAHRARDAEALAAAAARLREAEGHTKDCQDRLAALAKRHEELSALKAAADVELDALRARGARDVDAAAAQAARLREVEAEAALRGAALTDLTARFEETKRRLAAAAGAHEGAAADAETALQRERDLARRLRAQVADATEAREAEAERADAAVARAARLEGEAAALRREVASLAAAVEVGEATEKDLQTQVITWRGGRAPGVLPVSTDLHPPGSPPRGPATPSTTHGCCRCATCGRPARRWSAPWTRRRRAPRQRRWRGSACVCTRRGTRTACRRWRRRPGRARACWRSCARSSSSGPRWRRTTRRASGAWQTPRRRWRRPTPRRRGGGRATSGCALKSRASAPRSRPPFVAFVPPRCPSLILSL